MFNPYPSSNLFGIYESTYSAKERIVIDKKLRNKDVYNLHQELRHTLLEKKGNCLFPAFSLDRTPNLLYIVKQILDSDKDLKDIQVIFKHIYDLKKPKIYLETHKIAGLLFDGKNYDLWLYDNGYGDQFCAYTKDYGKTWALTKEELERWTKKKDLKAN